MNPKPENSDLLFPARTNKRYNFLIRNHRKLIRVMQQITKDQHQQGTFGEPDKDSWCGTSACALGWAALSGRFNGLGYFFSDGSRSSTGPFAVPIDQARYIVPIAQGYPGYKFGEAYTAAINHRYKNNRMDYSERDAAFELSLGDWEPVGAAWFGNRTFNEVFASASHDRAKVIKLLDRRIRELKSDMKKNEWNRPIR